MAELAVDIGTIFANGRSAELRELEIELIGGDPRGLFDIARRLFPDGGLRFSRLSKSGRGYLLAAEGAIEPPLSPRHANDVDLAALGTIEEAVSAMLRECADQIIRNMEVVAALDDAEGPHQLRVGLRRLRTALKIFGPIASSPELARIDDLAKELAREVGRLRDLDAVREDIVDREIQTHPAELALDKLARRLDGLATHQRRTLREVLARRQTQAFLLDLVCFVETRGWLVAEDIEQTARLAQPVGSAAVDALDGLWKKTRKRARKLDTLDVEQRHELRKQLKKLRYGIEFFASLYPERRVASFGKPLKKLQDVFGGLNDAAMVHEMFDEPSFASADDAQMQRAIGWVLGASQARGEAGWTDAKARWRDLKKARAFWK